MVPSIARSISSDDGMGNRMLTITFCLILFFQKLQIERDKKQMEYDEKMANIKIERQKQK